MSLRTKNVTIDAFIIARLEIEIDEMEDELKNITTLLSESRKELRHGFLYDKGMSQKRAEIRTFLRRSERLKKRILEKKKEREDVTKDCIKKIREIQKKEEINIEMMIEESERKWAYFSFDDEMEYPEDSILDEPIDGLF